MLIAFLFFSTRQIYQLLVVEDRERRSVGQVPGSDSPHLQKPHHLSSRDKVDHIYQEKSHIEGLDTSITEVQVYQKKLLDVVLANTDISSCTVSVVKVVLVARGRKKPGRQDSALVLNCVCLWL